MHTDASMKASQLKLIEVYDTDDEHECGGQDLPYLVTASHEGLGDYQSVAALIHAEKSLVAFNVQPAASRYALPEHVEFCTFESLDVIYRFFGVPQPPSLEEELARRYWQSTYARTVGELRVALADFPDDFPLIHTGNDENLNRLNRLGVHVRTNRWSWATAEDPLPGSHGGWAMRIGELDHTDWEKIVSGSWKDKRHADIK